MDLEFCSFLLLSMSGVLVSGSDESSTGSQQFIRDNENRRSRAHAIRVLGNSGDVVDPMLSIDAVFPPRYLLP